MEGLLHPVGPEDVRTYWIRRGGAMAVLLVLMIGLGLIISNLGGADGNATSAEMTAAPAPPAEPAIAEAPPPPPPPAPPENGVANDVTNEEAVPVPSSARSAVASSKPASQVDERSSDDVVDSRSGSKPEPEPANTFHLTTEATSSPSW